MNRCTTRFAFGAKCGTGAAPDIPDNASMPKPVPVRFRKSRREVITLESSPFTEENGTEPRRFCQPIVGGYLFKSERNLPPAARRWAAALGRPALTASMSTWICRNPAARRTKPLI